MRRRETSNDSALICGFRMMLDEGQVSRCSSFFELLSTYQGGHRKARPSPAAMRSHNHEGTVAAPSPIP
ncbi:hypothetical protein B0H34DRAFT_192130 [Crassisporium funariophilum]|nr:hypothetical protein B0H34DRAFT_192130 [Crassisporium funariophilum]